METLHLFRLQVNTLFSAVPLGIVYRRGVPSRPLSPLPAIAGQAGRGPRVGGLCRPALLMGYRVRVFSVGKKIKGAGGAQPRVIEGAGDLIGPDMLTAGATEHEPPTVRTGHHCYHHLPRL